MSSLQTALQILYCRSLRTISLIWAVIFYLLEPDAAFIAVLVAVMLDFLTKLLSLAIRNQGLINGVRIGAISSRKAFLGTLAKLVAYFSLGVLATQVQYVASLEMAAVLSKTVIYSFLFTVEAISILENLVDSGFTHFSQLLSSLGKAIQRK